MSSTSGGIGMKAFAEQHNTKPQLPGTTVVSPTATGRAPACFRDCVKPGDLVYGLATLSTMRIMGELPRPWPIIDYINNAFIGLDQLDYSTSRTPTSRAVPYIGAKPDEPESVREHRSYLESHLKYDPRFIAGASFAESRTRIVRACKGGLERVVSSSDRRRVHVLLDEVNLEQIVRKSGGFSYFAMELRKAYRMWLSQPQRVEAKLVFWKDGIVVEAPWSAARSLWSEYQPRLRSERSDVPRLVDAARQLLYRGGFASVRDSKLGKSPLQVACAEGNIEAARGILLLTPDHTIEGDELRAALASGNVALVRALLEEGRYDFTSGWRGNPLLWAIDSGVSELVQLVLERGAPRDKGDWNGRTPETAALATRDGRIIALVCPQHATPLCQGGTAAESPASWYGTMKQWIGVSA